MANKANGWMEFIMLIEKKCDDKCMVTWNNK